MTTELRLRHQSQTLFVRALAAAWRNGVQLYDPTLWLTREPELEEKMLRDADIAGAVQMRKHAIAGQDWQVLPANDASPRAPMATHVATELLKKIRGFTQARLNLSRAFFSGSRFARVLGQPQTLTIGDGRPRTWWVPVRLEDMDKRMFRIVPDRNPEDPNAEPTAHWERFSIGSNDFEPETLEDAAQTIRHVYEDDQSTLGHGRGLRDALAWWWWAKEHVFLESLGAVEQFARGILAAKVDGVRDAETGLPNEELMKKWRDVLEDLRARHVLVYDSRDNVEVIKGNAEGWQLLETIRAELKTTIVTLILQANLPTIADGDGGSYALAKEQGESTQMLLRFDREILEETLTHQLLGCLWFKNRPNLVELGVAEERPLFHVSQEKTQDPKERAEVASIASGMGLRLSADDVYEQVGFRRPEEGEEVVEPPAPAPDPFGPQPLPFRRSNR